MRALLKIQVPIATTLQKPECLVYNQDRSFQTMVPFDDSMKALMRGRLKAYYYADVEGKDQIFLDAEAPEQDW